jgi:fucose permease
MTVLALLGVKALYLLYAWLASAIVASYLSKRKGYGERPGLATGLVLSALGVLVWLFWPAKPDSSWKTEGILRRRGRGGRAG